MTGLIHFQASPEVGRIGCLVVPVTPLVAVRLASKSIEGSRYGVYVFTNITPTHWASTAMVLDGLNVAYREAGDPSRPKLVLRKDAAKAFLESVSFDL